MTHFLIVVLIMYGMGCVPLAIMAANYQCNRESNNPVDMLIKPSQIKTWGDLFQFTLWFNWCIYFAMAVDWIYTKLSELSKKPIRK